MLYSSHRWKVLMKKSYLTNSDVGQDFGKVVREETMKGGMVVI